MFYIKLSGQQIVEVVDDDGKVYRLQVWPKMYQEMKKAKEEISQFYPDGGVAAYVDEKQYGFISGEVYQLKSTNEMPQDLETKLEIREAEIAFKHYEEDVAHQDLKKRIVIREPNGKSYPAYPATYNSAQRIDSYKVYIEDSNLVLWAPAFPEVLNLEDFDAKAKLIFAKSETLRKTGFILGTFFAKTLKFYLPLWMTLEVDGRETGVVDVHIVRE